MTRDDQVIIQWLAGTLEGDVVTARKLQLDNLGAFDYLFRILGFPALHPFEMFTRERLLDEFLAERVSQMLVRLDPTAGQFGRVATVKLHARHFDKTSGRIRWLGAAKQLSVTANRQLLHYLLGAGDGRQVQTLEAGHLADVLTRRVLDGHLDKAF